MNETKTETKTETAEEKQHRLAFRSKLLGWLIFTIARTIYWTLRIRLHNWEGLPKDKQGGILVTWHGRTLIPANAFRDKGYWALISLSRDGELQNNIFQRFGFQTIRGSTGRGGIKGALQMSRKVKEGGILAFTPDGPRGPARKVQQGVILMAEKSGVPIIPVANTAKWRWFIKSWDKFMIPKPFSEAHFLIGEPIYIPANLTEEQRNQYAEVVENAINSLEQEAEQKASIPPQQL